MQVGISKSFEENELKLLIHIVEHNRSMSKAHNSYYILSEKQTLKTMFRWNRCLWVESVATSRISQLPLSINFGGYQDERIKGSKQANRMSWSD
jgi:hypothetical protein